MLVISCYIMFLFLFFGTCLFCYSYLNLLKSKYRKTVFRESARGNYTLRGEERVEHRQMVYGDG